MSDSFVHGWLPLRFEDPSPIDEHRVRLYEWLGAPDVYRLETDPHLSVVSVAVPATSVDRLDRSVRALLEGLAPWTIEIDGYRLWPSSRNPMVVALDAPFPIDRFASPIADAVATVGGRLRRVPPVPHVTLFLGGAHDDRLPWSRVDERVRRRLRAVVSGASASEPPEELVDPSFELRATFDGIEWA